MWPAVSKHPVSPASGLRPVVRSLLVYSLWCAREQLVPRANELLRPPLVTVSPPETVDAGPPDPLERTPVRHVPQSKTRRSSPASSPALCTPDIHA